MRQANEIVVKSARGACITIVAGPMEGGLAVHQAFAAHAAEIGADAAIMFFPERYYGDDAILGFFRAVSQATGTAVMIHEMPMRNGLGGGTVQYGLDLLERITDLPGVAGLKEECMEPGYSYRLLRRLAEKTGIIGAGSMRCYMRDYHAGARAYLVGVGSFLPKVEIAFHEAMARHDIDRAHALARGFEDPYFDVAVGLGWHRALKETLHLFDLMPPFERAPMPRLDLKGRERLAGIVDGLGWRARDPLLLAV
jgi:dihydrodipicolinate synthase/N-acetylneuraminate lyase